MSLLALGLVCLLTSTAFFALGNADTRSTQPSPDPPAKVGPGFRVYSMSELSRTEEANKTTIRFTSSALPFDFRSLVFRDYTVNTVIGATYYAGSGMILNASGQNGNVALREQDGIMIQTIEYQGQSSIVFNGETVYTSTTKATTLYEGTDLLVQDWLKGTWSPEKGVVLERPTGMTIKDSEFYLMVFQPPATVPEFGALPAVAVLMMAVAILLSRPRHHSGAP